MQLYDMHSHILPGIDDGSKSIEESVELLNALKKQGVNNVCLTPHFYTHHLSAEDFLKKRDEAFETLKPHIPKDMRVLVGAEVYATKFMFNGDDFSGACIGKSRYIMTEHSYNARFTEHTMGYFQRLIEEYNMIPILPHFERYTTLMDNPSILRELRDMGVVIQTNASSYIKKTSFFAKHKRIKFIKDGLVDILGTDVHSMTRNNPEAYTEAVEYISQKAGQEAVEKMMLNAEKIFEAAL